MTRGMLTGERSDLGDRDEAIQIALLGPMVVTRAGQTIDVTGPKRRAILALLALHLGTPLGRDRIIDAIWPQRQTGREESTLRVHVSHLRDELEPHRGDEPKILVTRGQAYLLSDHVVELDTRMFEELTREARAHLENDPATALELLDEALGLWHGRPLQDVEYEEFAQEPIRALERAHVDAIEDRAEAMIAVAEDISAIQDLEPLVRDDPTRERATSLLMLALYHAGRQADSLRTARRHARHLSQQGLEPSPKMADLEERILNHDPTLLPEESITPDDLRVGRSVRGYELREDAGRGSVGVVYRAFQPAVGRYVALKAIAPDVAGSPEFVRRFAEEARVIASLEHPHIVPLHDFWREPSGAFLVMRWMDDGSLADRLGKSWDIASLARVFDQIADALGYAHVNGVVHRDVKPANVLFDGAGNAYLCDFGLAATGIDTGVTGSGALGTVEPPYGSPELGRGEGPTVASDIFGLGVMLAEAASGKEFPEAMTSLPGSIWEVVSVATAENPADRFPDTNAFRLALREGVGEPSAPAPRRVRRNPYKGLEPFDETDAADFYGRDDVVDSLLDAVANRGLVAVVSASGSGKSSVVKAGLVPALRAGAVHGSEDWFIVSMVPGTDPFDEFYISLREAAVGPGEARSRDVSTELRDAFSAALDGPNGRALLVIDQFEELFSPGVSDESRERFLDNLAGLANEPSHPIRVVVTMRADFSHRPLAHPRFGELFATASYLLAPMREEQVEEVIRGPARRVGIQVEPGLISEIVRDIADSPAYLPLLQYVLSELFERRTEDRLTVQAYRSLGGVEGVLERQAESTYSAVSDSAKTACRQLFLRMVALGDHGEQTRRRLPLTEVSGLADRGDLDEVLEAFSGARLLTYDRDPVSRTPTVEVAHETVIDRWTRFRVWIDEARSDVLAHRRVSAAALTWLESGEDPSYLLTGGPLVSALDLSTSGRVLLNSDEVRFVEESRLVDEAARRADEERREQESRLRSRARRRLAIGVSAALVALVVGVLAIFAFVQRQRADELASVQSRENLGRELAGASVANLDSADPDLSLLLAIAAAEETLNSGGEILPEAVEALHQAVINPRSELLADDALGDTDGEAISYSNDGASLAYVTADGAIAILDPRTGLESLRTDTVDPPVRGVDFHPAGNHFLSIHSDGVREWDATTGEMIRSRPGSRVSVADYSTGGDLIAIGDESGAITIHGPEAEVMTLDGEHVGRITSIDFDPSDTRLVSAGFDGRVLVWDLSSGNRVSEAPIVTGFCVYEASWHPTEDQVAVTLCHGEAFTFDPNTDQRLHAFSLANQAHTTISFDGSGALVVGSGVDGVTRVFGSGVGGEAAIDLPNGGVPVDDVAFNPANSESGEIVTLGLDGELRIWRDALAQSELPHHHTTLLFPFMDATPDGGRYVVGSNSHIFGLSQDPEVLPPVVQVVDAATGEVVAEHQTLWDLGFRRKPTISDDGSIAAFAGPTGNVVLLSVEDGVAEEIPDSARWTSDLDFSSDGHTLAGGGFDGQVAVWDVASRTRTRVMRAGVQPLEDGQRLLPARQINEVEFRPASDELVTAAADGSVRVWSIADGTNEILQVFGYEVWSVDVTADGASVAAADTSGTVRLLNIVSGEEILPTPQRVAGNSNVVFSPDGRYLAGGGPGLVVHLWDLETGEVVRRFQGAVGKPIAVFVKGGTELRAVGGEGIVRGYVLDPVDLLEIARQEIGRDMTEEECQRYLGRSCAS